MKREMFEMAQRLRKLMPFELEVGILLTPKGFVNLQLHISADRIVSSQCLDEWMFAMASSLCA